MSKEKIIQKYINQITDQIKARQVSIDKASSSKPFISSFVQNIFKLSQAQLTLMRTIKN